MAKRGTMYGKYFASCFTGSMSGAGVSVFAVWGYVIAHCVDGQVELNPRVVAAMIGTTEEEVVKAIAYLEAPDPNSRSKSEDGRRLVREGMFAYRVVNHAAYRRVRDENDRREYNRNKQAESRARRVNTSVKESTDESTMSAKAEADTEAEADTKPRSARQKKSNVGTLEAGEIINRIKALATRNPMNGSANISRKDVEALGTDILRAYDAIGGAPRFTKDDNYVMLHFSRALSEAREA